MATLKDRVAATEQRLKELKESRKAADQARRQARRVDRGEWDEADFRQMMDEALCRPADRRLFDLE